MRYIKATVVLLLFLSLKSVTFGQSKKFERLLKNNLKESVPILRVSEIESNADYLFLDARETKEFQTSHIEGAIPIGFDFFDVQKIEQSYPNKTRPIIVYCSIGVRSELVGEKLRAAGYTNVYNLYGGIFEWKNQSKQVVDSVGVPTEKVHTYSKEWSRWLSNGEKIYED